MRRTTKILFFLFLILLLLGGFFGFNRLLVQADSEEFLFTEIMYKPAKNSSGNKTEWVELIADKNIVFFKKTASCNSDCQLKDFYVCSKISASEDATCLSSYPVYAFGSVIPIVNKDDMFVIAKSPEFFLETYPDFDGILLKSNFNLLENSDASIAYSLDNKATWEGFVLYDNFFQKKEEGRSLERVDFQNQQNSVANWQESYQKNGTPGKKSSIKKVYAKEIFFNELLPHPKEESEGVEFIELFNPSEKDIKLDDWHIIDYGGNECNLSEKIIKNASYLILKDNTEEECAIALNNTGEEIVELRDPNDDVAATVSYPSSKEGQSYSFNGINWKWTKFLTEGKENIFNNEPYGTVKIDEDIFINVYADFFVSTNDADGEEVKVVWDFGDGHKSYLEKTRHKYDQEGIFTGTVKLSDESEDVIKNFTVEVKKYPTPKIKIVKIKANPKGKDTEGEEIYLKNKSKEKVNLKTWSIATGSKTLYNHPITKDFIIKPGKTKKITRKYSLFTLNNKKGVIELRYPNGEVASRVKYDKKKESVKDDEVYELSGKKWRWNAPPEETPLKEIIPEENPEDVNSEIELEISEEEIILNLGKYSSENKLALAEIGFLPIPQNLLQSRENSGIVLGAFSVRSENRKLIEIKPITSWQKTLQKSNQLFNLLINQIVSLI